MQEIFIGLEKVKQLGISECVLGIDTWGVDYVLIGASGEKLADPISYRDKRTLNAVQNLTSEYPREYIYKNRYSVYGIKYSISAVRGRARFTRTSGENFVDS